MAGSGTTRLESADENRLIHVNSWEVDTDPYLLDGVKMNGELVAQYPRTVTWQASAGIVPNTGTLAYQNFNFGPPTLTLNTFASKIPSIDSATEVTTVPAATTNVYFPRGGLWHIAARFVYPNNHATVNTGVTGIIDLSTNGGGAWIPFARFNTVQPAVAAPVMISGNCNLVYSFPTSGVLTDTRLRFAVASSEAMAGGITLFVTFTKLRN